MKINLCNFLKENNLLQMGKSILPSAFYQTAYDGKIILRENNFHPYQTHPQYFPKLEQNLVDSLNHFTEHMVSIVKFN